MSEIIDICVATVNETGRAFYDCAAGMFVQVAVLVAVLLCVDGFLRKRIRATLRYWIWMLVFVKLLLPPSLCVPTGIGYWFGRGEALPAPSVVPQIVEVAKPPAPTSVGLPIATPVVRSAESVPTVVKPRESIAESRVSLTWQGGALLLWIAGVLVFAALVVQRWRFVKELVARSEPAAEDQIDRLDQCRRRMNVRSPVFLRLLPDAFSPAVCGLLHPTILAPRALLDRLPPEGLEAVLIHELAHVKRGDLWINSLQTVLQAAYFYNPLVWLASAIVRRVREQAVDEMAIVALGAEARSYGNTLIDIAEMAFLRTSPALRLIGVAESRKSLEGRIRHMMTRPMPKNAKVGAIGVLFVAAVGAILLPMARAAVEPQPRFVANLPGGATVELMGICNWPTSGPTAWRADGSSLDRPLYARKWNVTPGVNDYGFLFRVTGNDDIDLMWNRIEGGEGSEGSCDVVDEQGNRIEGGNAAVASMKPSTSQTTLRVGLPTGPWNTISSHDGKRMSSVGGVLWSQAFQDASGTGIVASTESREMRKHRIAAIDTEGAVHVATTGGSVSSGSVHQFTAHFPDLVPDRIKEFRYQTRECQIMEFQGVSLRPGQKTEVRIEMAKTAAVSVSATASRRSTTGNAPAGRANIFVMAPQVGFNVFDAIITKADGWAYNRTGRYHSKQGYDEIFDGTHHRTDRDVLVLVFSLDREDRIPGGYEDFLPKPWSQIEDQLRRGEIVELSGRARGLYVVLLAAPSTEQLKQMIAESRFLANPFASADSSGRSEFQGYVVDRSVADFPAGEGFSTPEAAYATINRMDWDDPSSWQKVTVARKAARMGGSGSEPKRTVDPEWAKVLHNARIREVLVWNMTRAAVIAELPQELSSKKIVEPIDVRFLQLENGRWLNTGNGGFSSVEAAKTHFMTWMERDAVQADAMRDPLSRAPEIKAAAAVLFEKLRTADYAEILSHYRDGKWDSDFWKVCPTSGLYTVQTDYPSFVLWCCTHFKDNPIIDVQLGDVFIGDALISGKTGWPTVPYKLTLKDGSVLAGNLPFSYEIDKGRGHWHGMEGIDWHLWPNGTK
jgi:beta-lactamase regulating signal transducer with metallopeptidase domain